MGIFFILLGIGLWFLVISVVTGFYVVDQNERAVKTIFGKAERLRDESTLNSHLAETISEEERKRYVYPLVRVIPPGGPYFKWPWEKIHKVSVATETLNMTFDPANPSANTRGNILDAVTKDHLNVGLSGQIRCRVSEQNLYAYIFGIKNPTAHIMGYFVSVLRAKIANFQAKSPIVQDEHLINIAPQSISINDLRKNLRQLNEVMDLECRSSEARYGIVLDASLITEIDPPPEVESALAAINTAHNQVSSDISVAQAQADQKIVQSRRAVEIETLQAQAEVEPLLRLGDELTILRDSDKNALKSYVRNAAIPLFARAKNIIKEVSNG